MKYIPLFLFGVLFFCARCFQEYLGSYVLILWGWISYIWWWIVCFCQSFKCKWQRFDFFIFAIPVIMFIYGVYDRWRFNELDDSWWWWLLLIPVISRLIVMRNSVNYLIKFLFSRENYFKSLILIFAAIITLCILIVTYRFLNPPRY